MLSVQLLLAVLALVFLLVHVATGKLAEWISTLLLILAFLVHIGSAVK